MVKEMGVPKDIEVSAREKRALILAVILALFGAFLLARNYLAMIAVAIIVAFLFTPVYEWLLKKTNNQGHAAGLTLLITVLALVIPVTLVLVLTVAQASTIVNDIAAAVSTTDVTNSLQGLLDWLNNFLSNISGQAVHITQTDVQEFFAQYSTNIVSFVVTTITSWVGSLGSLITNIILYMYVFTAILVHQKKITRLIGQLNPVGEGVTSIYLSRAAAMTKAMVKGQFIIAVIQGAESAVVLYIAGLQYFTFFLLLLSFMSIIPLGAGIITIPIGIVLMLTGNVWQGALVILNHLIIVTNIDNVLKPKLVPQSVRLQPALILLSVFGGMALFGFLGIIIGPVLMILITTTIEVYLQAYGKGLGKEDKPAKAKA